MAWQSLKFNLINICLMYLTYIAASVTSLTTVFQGTPPLRKNVHLHVKRVLSSGRPICFCQWFNFFVHKSVCLLFHLSLTIFNSGIQLHSRSVLWNVDHYMLLLIQIGLPYMYDRQTLCKTTTICFCCLVSLCVCMYVCHCLCLCQDRVGLKLPGERPGWDWQGKWQHWTLYTWPFHTHALLSAYIFKRLKRNKY